MNSCCEEHQVDKPAILILIEFYIINVSIQNEVPAKKGLWISSAGYLAVSAETVQSKGGGENIYRKPITNHTFQTHVMSTLLILFNVRSRFVTDWSIETQVL